MPSTSKLRTWSDPIFRVHLVSHHQDRLNNTRRAAGQQQQVLPHSKCFVRHLGEQELQQGSRLCPIQSINPHQPREPRPVIGPSHPGEPLSPSFQGAETHPELIMETPIGIPRPEPLPQRSHQHHDPAPVHSSAHEQYRRRQRSPSTFPVAAAQAQSLEHILWQSRRLATRFSKIVCGMQRPAAVGAPLRLGPSTKVNVDPMQKGKKADTIEPMKYHSPAFWLGLGVSV